MHLIREDLLASALGLDAAGGAEVVLDVEGRSGDWQVEFNASRLVLGLDGRTVCSVLRVGVADRALRLGPDVSDLVGVLPLVRDLVDMEGEPGSHSGTAGEVGVAGLAHCRLLPGDSVELVGVLALVQDRAAVEGEPGSHWGAAGKMGVVDLGTCNLRELLVWVHTGVEATMTSPVSSCM